MERTKFPKNYPKPKKRWSTSSKYNETVLRDAEDLVSMAGARNKDLAEYFGVSVKTIEYWVTTKPEFKRALKRARMKNVLRASRSLFNLAVGYEHKDTFISQYRGQIITKEYMKRYPPNFPALSRYLSIMMREVWAEKTSMELSANLNVEYSETLTLDNFSDEEKELLFNMGMRQLSPAQEN